MTFFPSLLADSIPAIFLTPLVASVIGNGRAEKAAIERSRTPGWASEMRGVSTSQAWKHLCVAQVSFDRDVEISQNNEYEILQLMMGDCRDRLSNYPGIPLIIFPTTERLKPLCGTATEPGGSSILHVVSQPSTLNLLCVSISHHHCSHQLRNNRHTGDAPSNQPQVAGVFPRRNVGTLKLILSLHPTGMLRRTWSYTDCTCRTYDDSGNVWDHRKHPSAPETFPTPPLRVTRERIRRRIPSYSPSKFGIHGENLIAPVISTHLKKLGVFSDFWGKKTDLRAQDGQKI